MHEGNFTEQIVQTILDELKKYPAQKPVAVKVRVGEMLHLVPESVRLHFATLTKGTALENTALELAEDSVLAQCQACTMTYHPEDHHLLVCPGCGALRANVIKGRDVFIEKIDLEN